MSKILISGGSGLVGKSISQLLLKQGHQVVWLGRVQGEWQGIKKFKWDPETSYIEKEAFEGVEHIIHLAGAGIADKVWTKSYKEELLSSRIKSSALLYRCVKENKFPIKTIIGASAIGYYGYSNSDKVFTEEDKPDTSFLSELSVKWENSYTPFSEAGIRVAIVRIGIVLSKDGGFYAKLAPLYKLGLGSVFTKKTNYLSWIHIKDVSALFVFCLKNKNCQGVFNAVSSESTLITDFSRQFAASLNKPLFMPVLPEFFARLIMGERSVMLTKGVRVSNEKIKALGFEFEFDTVEKALEDIKR